MKKLRVYPRQHSIKVVEQTTIYCRTCTLHHYINFLSTYHFKCIFFCCRCTDFPLWPFLLSLCIGPSCTFLLFFSYPSIIRVGSGACFCLSYYLVGQAVKIPGFSYHSYSDDSLFCISSPDFTLRTRFPHLKLPTPLFDASITLDYIQLHYLPIVIKLHLLLSTFLNGTTQSRSFPILLIRIFYLLHSRCHSLSSVTCYFFHSLLYFSTLSLYTFSLSTHFSLLVLKRIND